MQIQIRWKLVAVLAATLLAWSDAAHAYKGYLALWQPGTGKYYWHSGMTLDKLKSLDDTYFAQGLRLTTVDVYQDFSFPPKTTYAAVWRPGSGEQRWRASMSYQQFRAQDDAYFARGLRLAALDILGGSVFAVWRPGVGAQHWRLQMSNQQLKDQDKEYFGKGLRLAMLTRHSDGFAAVWRPGTGAQRWVTGMTTSTFKEKDKDFLGQGLRLVAVERFDGRWNAVWRAGAGEQRVSWGMPFDTLKTKTREHADRGLRLVQINTNNYESEQNNTPDESSGDGGGSSSSGAGCQVQAVAVSNVCYNLTGEPSTIIKPGQFFGYACGANQQQAQARALVMLALKVCVTTPQEKRAGCCTYTFQ